MAGGQSQAKRFRVETRPGRQVLFLALLCLLVGLPNLLTGYPMGHDWLQELSRVLACKNALQLAADQGQWPVIWAGGAYGGYGSPIFLYYAPLFNIVSALFAGITGSVAWGSVATLVLASFVGAWMLSQCTLLLCSFSTAGEMHPLQQEKALSAARIAAGVLLLSPYLVADRYVRNANAEYTALCLLPVLLYGALRMRDKPYQGVLLYSLGLAAVIVTHNITGVAALVLGFAYAVLQTCNRRVLVGTSCATVLGLALAAFFWLPAFWLKDLVQVSRLTHGRFGFAAGFQSLGTLFSYDAFFSLGWLWPVLLASLVLTIVLLRKRNVPGVRFVAVPTVLSLCLLALVTAPSRLLWETLPLLPYFQFPWRFLGPMSVLLALACGIGVFCLGESYRKFPWRMVERLVFFLLLGNALLAYTPARPVAAEVLDALQRKSAADRYNAQLDLTITDEFLPLAAKISTYMGWRPETGPVVLPPRQADIRVIRDLMTDIELAVRSRAPVRLRLARWYFPGWEASVNGVGIPLAANRGGSFDIPVPAGESRVVCRYRAPRLCSYALGVSLAAAVFWMLLLIVSRTRR